MDGSGVKFLRKLAQDLEDANIKVAAEDVSFDGTPSENIPFNLQRIQTIRRLAKYYDELEQYARDRDRQLTDLLTDYQETLDMVRRIFN